MEVGGSDSGSPYLYRTRLMSMLVSLLINILKEYIKINLFFKKFTKLYKVIAQCVQCTWSLQWALRFPHLPSIPTHWLPEQPSPAGSIHGKCCHICLWIVPLGPYGVVMFSVCFFGFGIFYNVGHREFHWSGGWSRMYWCSSCECVLVLMRVSLCKNNLNLADYLHPVSLCHHSCSHIPVVKVPSIWGSHRAG
jgi:hypothetical protein